MTRAGFFIEELTKIKFFYGNSINLYARVAVGQIGTGRDIIVGASW
jgi:hypothetical protein